MIEKFTQYRDHARILNVTLALGLVGLTPLLGGRVLDSLLVLLVLNVLLDRNSLKNIKRNLPVTLLLSLYPLANIASVYLSDPSEYSELHAPANYKMWGWSFVALPLTAALWSPQAATRFVKYIVPASVAITFAVTLYMWTETRGRVEPFGHSVFYAPLLTTSLTLIYLAHRQRHKSHLTATGLALVGSTLIISITFSQTRGIFLAQLTALSFLVAVQIGRRQWRAATALALTTALGVAIGTATLALASPSNLTRLKDAAEAARLLLVPKEVSRTSDARDTQSEEGETPAQGTDNANNPTASEPTKAAPAPETSTQDHEQKDHTGLTGHLLQVSTQIEVSSAYRLRFWSMAMDQIVTSPLTGYGAAQEPKFIAKYVAPHFPHVHNMYLSWLLWGGLITLATGIAFLAAPLIARWRQPNAAELASPTILWATALFFDSFLVYPAFHYIFILFGSLAYTATRAEGATV